MRTVVQLPGRPEFKIISSFSDTKMGQFFTFLSFSDFISFKLKFVKIDKGFFSRHNYYLWPF